MVAKTAAALCVASRWWSAASLLLSAAALAAAARADSPASLMLPAIVLAGAAQAYLAFRIEFDRRIFEAVADSGAEAFSRFDAAMGAIGLARPSAARSAQDRAAGLWRLVRSSGLLVAVQFALALAAMWEWR